MHISKPQEDSANGVLVPTMEIGRTRFREGRSLATGEHGRMSALPLSVWPSPSRRSSL